MLSDLCVILPNGRLDTAERYYRQIEGLRCVVLRKDTENKLGGTNHKRRVIEKDGKGKGSF